MNDRSDDLRGYPRRKVTSRIPYGYRRDPSDASMMVPDEDKIKALEQAFDQIDEGRTMRQAAAWLSSVSDPISHVALRGIWRKARPESIKKKKHVRNELTREERLAKNRRQKIAREKQRITAAKKRVERLQDEVADLQKKDERNKAWAKPMVEIDYESIDYEKIGQEAKDHGQDIIWQPNKGPQTEFVKASEFEVLYGGAAGGGKSNAIIADPLRYFQHKNFVGLLLRRTHDELRELIWESKKLYPLAYPGAVWREKDKEWQFPSGARFWITYLDRDDDVMRYQGQAFCWVGFDELTQYPTPFAWNYLRSRVRTTDPSLAPYLSMRATTNPGGIGHGWVKKMFIDPAPYNQAFWATNIETGEVIKYPDDYEDPEKAGRPLFKRRFIPSRLSDNPYFSDGAYEANLLSLPESQRRQLLEGDWTVADGAAFPEFRMKDHVVEPFVVPQDWRRFRSCDFGYASAAAVHWYAVSPEGTLFVYRELYTRKKTGRELARQILELEREERVNYGVMDSSLWMKRGETGPTIVEEMISEGCRWRPSDRSKGSRTAGKNRLHELLRVDPDTGMPGIVFFDTCRQIIADLPLIPNDPDGADDIDPRYANDHAYDSIRYGIMTRPKPFDPFTTTPTAHRFAPADPVFGY